MNNRRVTLGSFLPEDVILLFKDVTGLVSEGSAREREAGMREGRHYSEDLPREELPSPQYLRVYHELLRTHAPRVAHYVAVLTQLVAELEGAPVLLSLARAGTPCGVLMRRYASYFLGLDLPHYSVSIIRDKGFDENAIAYVRRLHPDRPLVFVDGWTGKGVIARELAAACTAYSAAHPDEPPLLPKLAVLADPARVTTLYAVREDFLNPSCCLNSTVCGLLSRTVHNQELIGPDDFHGVRVYREFADHDLTAAYLEEICAHFSAWEAESITMVKQLLTEDRTPDWSGLRTAENIRRDFGLRDLNHVKPGIGETTRVLLRRLPDRVLCREEHSDLRHIHVLAEEKSVPVEYYPQMPYLCCGLIQEAEA